MLGLGAAWRQSGRGAACLGASRRVQPVGARRGVALLALLASIGWHAPGEAGGEAGWGAQGRLLPACSPLPRGGPADAVAASSTRPDSGSPTVAARLCRVHALARLKGGGGRRGKSSARVTRTGRARTAACAW